MSKKVLNYAGKRPMLLALTIMATLTLGLLFSGWLTPTTGRAQGGPNPPPNQENTNTNCVEHGPYTNCSPNCGSVTDNGTLTNTSLCVQQGGTLPYPDWLVEPTISAGSIVSTVTYDCTDTVTKTTNTVTYTISAFGFNPPEPYDTANASLGDHTSQCHVTAISSDTNCSNINIPCGSVTWHIVSAALIETILGFDPAGSQWKPSGASFVGEPAGAPPNYQYDGFKVNYSATVSVGCTRGCSTQVTSGTRTSSYINNQTIECYKVGSNGITVALPEELVAAVGELLASQIDDNIPLYGVDSTVLQGIVNAVNGNAPRSASAGQWQGGNSPCNGY